MTDSPDAHTQVRSLAGRRVAITGGTTGIGRAIAARVEPGKTGSDMQLPDVPVEKQREQIGKETMLRAEDIAVGVHYMLTQPRRTVVQQLVIVPRAQAAE
uniref:hypothetical protein n=1 Tax=Sphingomonas sp. PL-96 TaxID=2887201 RepID=UPI002B4BACDB|nr:hypothetical protein [Sphingomonas sp. PL-96]